MRRAFPEQVEFAYASGRGFIADSVLGCPVYLGDGSDLERKLTTLAALEKELGRMGVKPAMIDLSVVAGAYYQ
jgi:hypothetical protein